MSENENACQHRRLVVGRERCPDCGISWEGLRAELRCTAAAQLAPAWTTTPPTEQGWYWARYKNGEIEPVDVSEWFGGVLVAWSTGWDVQTPLSDFDLWCGPIEPPPLPKETR